MDFLVFNLLICKIKGWTEGSFQNVPLQAQEVFRDAFLRVGKGRGCLSSQKGSLALVLFFHLGLLLFCVLDLELLKKKIIIIFLKKEVPRLQKDFKIIELVYQYQ